MQALAKFQVEKTAFGAAVRLLLVSQAGIDASSVSDGDHFAVWPRPGGDAFVGISPLLSVVGSTKSSSSSLIPSQSPEVRAATMQWCSLAAQLAACQVSLADVEARVNIPPGLPLSGGSFVAGTENPSAADLLLLSSIKDHMKQCKIEAPNLFKWAERVLKTNDVCQQFGTLASASVPSLPQQQQQQQQSSDDKSKNAKGVTVAGAPATDATTTSPTGKTEFAIPNAAEIAARRAAKEQAKKEKAEKEAAADQQKKQQQPAVAAAASSASSTSAAATDAQLSPDEGLDLRVGLITSVAAHPTAARLYVETIDLGEASGPRTIISGLVDHYKPEDLQNQLVVVVCNMKPKKLQGTESHGMVLCASTEKAVKFIQPPPSAKAGDCIAFGTNVAAAKPDKAIPSSTKMGQLLEGLRSDENGVCLWKDVPLTIGGNHPVTAPIAGVPIK